MKKNFLYLFSALAIMAGAVACDDKGNEGGKGGDGGDPGDPGTTKTVAVGTQTERANAGESTNVTYVVTTENIADGNYTVSVANRPSGVEIGNEGKVNITDNTGTLTLAVGATATAGTISTLRLTLDGKTSNNFALQIFAGAPSVAVGTQMGAFTEKEVGGNNASFSVTITNMTVGEHQVTVNNLPTGVSVVNNTLTFNAQGKANLLLAGSATTVADTYTNLTVTVDGTIDSPAFSLRILAIEKTVSVGSQQGSVIVGNSGTVSFTVTTTNIGDGSYDANIGNLPSGVTVVGQVTISNNTGTLTLNVSSSAAAGKTTNLTLTIDGTTSGNFTFAVSENKSLSVTQASTVTEGVVSSAVYFNINTIGDFSNETLSVANNITGSLPQGVTWLMGQFTASTRRFILSFDSSTQAGTYTLKLTIQGAETDFTITIDPSTK